MAMFNSYVELPEGKNGWTWWETRHLLFQRVSIDIIPRHVAFPDKIPPVAKGGNKELGFDVLDDFGWVLYVVNV